MIKGKSENNINNRSFANQSTTSTELKTSGGEQSEKKESTQSTLALIYVGCFLGIIVVILMFSIANHYAVTDIKDLLLAISGVLSGPLGLVIAFYFKEDSRK